MNRRDLLKLSALLTAGSVLHPLRALAMNVEPEHFFVLLRMQPGTSRSGGLDVTLGLDPWLQPQRPLQSDLFLEYKDADVTSIGDIHLGPSAKPLAAHAADLAVLNGVFMSEDDNGHPAAMAYMSSGNGSGHAADLPVELEALRGIFPYGLLAGVDVLYTALRTIPYAFAKDILSGIHGGDPTDALVNCVHDNRTPLERAIGEIIASRDVTTKLRDDLLAREKSGVQLKPQHVAAACFLSGAARHAEIDILTDLNVDTHGDHEGNHLKAQLDLWTQAADIFALFKSIPYGQGSLFDSTTFMAIADFARTPALNAAKGKDHNPLSNSVLFAGKGINKGKTVNSSLLISAARSKTGSSYHMASPFDFATGRSAQSRVGADFIYPQNIARTVAELMKVDPSKMTAVTAQTKVIPGLLS